MPSQKLEWTFNNNQIAVNIPKGYKKGDNLDIDRAIPFIFKLTVYKDADTQRETLYIECLKNNVLNGAVESTLTGLGGSLREFMDYGVAFKPVVYAGLQKTIELHYMDIHYGNPSANASIFTKAFNTIGDFASSYAPVKKATEHDDGMYHIPVADFDLLLIESGIPSYQLQSIKAEMKKRGYIKTGQGRYSNLKRLGAGAVTTRVISIIKDAFAEYLSADETKEPAMASGESK